MDQLTDQERTILAFERQWWQRPGAKEQAIRDLFGLDPTRYYQLLAGLVQKPSALEHDPMTVNRLRRRIESGARRRRAGRRAS